MRMLLASLFFWLFAASPAKPNADWLVMIEWIVAQTSYEYNGEPLPSITYESTQWLQILMYGEEMVARSEMPGSQTKLLTVVALYDNDANHIMINEDASAAEQEVYLLHELVHFMQEINGAFTHCIHAGEPEAYELHWRYAQEFELDVEEPNWLIPIMARSSCYTPHW